MRSETTAPVSSGPDVLLPALPVAVPTIVVVWCAADPARCGELAFLGGAARRLFGRGNRANQVRLVRQGRAGVTMTEPLELPTLSTEHLVFTLNERGTFVENVGGAPLSINGERVKHARLAHGDVLLVKETCALLYLERVPVTTSAHATAMPEHAHGEPNAFGMVGQSPAFMHLCERLAHAAALGRHTLLLGPTGTGKELAARAIHAMSARARGPFVARNVSTIPESIVDLELGGATKNFPNGITPERIGLFDKAAGGVLFADEIGEVSHAIHAHFLRALDVPGEYEHLGEGMRSADFLCVAATNRDAASLKHDLVGRFTIEIELPALEDRREDIPLLVRQMVLRCAREKPALAARFVSDGARPDIRIAGPLMAWLVRRPYPRNIRELDKVVAQVIEQSTGDTLSLTPQLVAEMEAARAQSPEATPAEAGAPTRDRIEAALVAHEGDLKAASATLGITRWSLARRAQDVGLDPKSYRKRRGAT
jgi:DNA-binding NtrC family response regulator